MTAGKHYTACLDFMKMGHVRSEPSLRTYFKLVEHNQPTVQSLTQEIRPTYEQVQKAAELLFMRCINRTPAKIP